MLWPTLRGSAGLYTNTHTHRDTIDTGRVHIHSQHSHVGDAGTQTSSYTQRHTGIWTHVVPTPLKRRASTHRTHTGHHASSRHRPGRMEVGEQGDKALQGPHCLASKPQAALRDSSHGCLSPVSTEHTGARCPTVHQTQWSVLEGSSR